LLPGRLFPRLRGGMGYRPQQLFGWRRQARLPAAAAPRFVPAVVEAQLPKRAVRHRERRRPRRGDRVCGIIEVEIDGVTVRVGRGAETRTVTAVLRALKTGA
jgi:transposase